MSTIMVELEARVDLDNGSDDNHHDLDHDDDDLDFKRRAWKSNGSDFLTAM
jgi:hypothetical protein